MKLKDIIPYCLKTKNGGFENKYYWMIQGETYGIDSMQRYYLDQIVNTSYSPYYRYLDTSVDYNFISLSRYFKHPTSSSAQSRLNLHTDNEITIFDKFIMVHKTTVDTTETEANLFTRQHYFVANGHDCSAEFYAIGLFHNDEMGGMATNLRLVFKDLIALSVPSKPTDLDARTLDQKLDDIVEELTQENRTKAIKKLKRMLNERL